MLFGFVDDTEFPATASGNKPDVFVFGGFFLTADRLGDLLIAISERKARHGLAPEDPVKWNLKDARLRRVYRERGKEDLLKRTIQASDRIRADLAQLAQEFDVTVMACALERLYEHVDQRDCYRWAMENFLQRVGLMLEGRSEELAGPSLVLVVDWPQRKSDKGLFDIYAAGYHHGKAEDSDQLYFSGPLRDLGTLDCLVFGSTFHSAPLQLADIVVGITRDFLLWCYKGTNEKRVRKFFPFIGNLFHRDGSGRIGGRGLHVSPRPVGFDIDQKIQEICGPPERHLLAPKDDEEKLPF